MFENNTYQISVSGETEQEFEVMLIYHSFVHVSSGQMIYGMPVTLSLIAESDSGIIDYEWYWRVPSAETGEMQYEKAGEKGAQLFIPSLKDEFYKCEITNGNNDTVTLEWCFAIEREFACMVPVPHQELEVELGSDVELKVPYFAGEGVVPVFSWSAENCSEAVETTKGDTIVLKNVQKKDLGRYFCYVTDGAERSFTMTFVIKDKNRVSDDRLLVPDVQYKIDLEYGENMFNIIPEKAGLYYLEVRSEKSVVLENRNGTGEQQIGTNINWREKLKKDKVYKLSLMQEDDKRSTVYIKLTKSTLDVKHTASQQADYGKSKTLEVNATSTVGDIRYEWYQYVKSPETGEFEFEKLGVTTEKCEIPKVISHVYRCVVTDKSNRAINADFYIKADTGLKVSSKHYETAYVKLGKDAKLKAQVDVEEGVELTYSWESMKNGYISGADSQTLKIKDVTKEDYDSYYCTIRDYFGNSVHLMFDLQEGEPRGFRVEKGTTKVGTEDAPGSDEQGNIYVYDIEIGYGDDYVMQVQAAPASGVTLTYTWYKGFDEKSSDKLVSGKNETSYALKNIKQKPGNLKYYTCVVSDGYEKERVYFCISTYKKWSPIERSLQFLYVEKGDNLKLSVRVEKDEDIDLKYSWYTVSYSGEIEVNTPISGAAKSSYTVKNVQEYTKYRCFIEDEYGFRDSVDYGVYINEGTWNLDYDRMLFDRVCVKKGEDVKLKVYTTGTEDLKLTYRWNYVLRPWENIEGATKSSYVVENVTKSVHLKCTVTDQYGNERLAFFYVNPSQSHIWGKTPVVDEKSTCLEKGKQSIHCRLCNASKDGTSESIPLGDHSWGKWKTTKEATYEAEGSKQRSCTVCGKKQTEVIKKKEITSLPKPESFKVSAKTSVKDGKTERKVELSWKAVKYATGYRVYRKVNDGSWETLKKLSGNGKISYTDTDVKAGECYYYRVRAYYDGSSKWVGGKYTSTEDVVFKPDQAKLTGTEKAAYNQIKITWEKAEAADGYGIYRRKSGESWAKLAEVNGQTEYLDKTAEPGISYYYRVRAYCKVEGKNVWGDYSSSSEKTATKLEKGKITSLKTSSSHQNTIKWEAVPGAEMYQIYCKEGKDGTYKKIKTTSSLSYTHKKLDKGTKYYYKVRAYRKNSEGEKSYSSYCSAKSVTCK